MPIKLLGQRPWLDFLSLAWITISGLLWLTLRGPAWLPILIVVIFIGFGFSAGRFPFRRTPFDLALLLFWLTALVGVWAAYGREAAWNKFWMLTLAMLIFYSLASQTEQNTWWVGGLVGFLGVLLSLYFLFVFDWRTLAADFRIISRIGLAWMRVRPVLPGQTLTPNNTAGILAGFLPYTLALGFYAWQQRQALKMPWLLVIVAACFTGLLALTIFMASSRGAWIALAAALSFWLIWALSEKLLADATSRRKLAFVLGWVAIGIIVSGTMLAFSGGPARILNLTPGLHTGQSRLEIDNLTLHLIGDFPFTGGGLRAFAGLFSEYMLVIPSIMTTYGHNLYLDVTLEQGLPGLLLLLVILGGSALLLFRAPVENDVHYGLNLLRQAALASLVVVVIHGFIDDPFYGEQGTPFVWVTAGLAVFIHPEAKTMASLLPPSMRQWGEAPGVRRRVWLAVGMFVLAIAVYGAFAWRTLAARGLANLGAVRMAQVQLGDFPTNEWSNGQIAGELVGAQRIFERVISLDPTNRTANHRLGLIAMLRRDYPTAIDYLDAAYQQDPGHRGVTKNLGYSYVWVGQYDQAQTILASIPEARTELNVYSWWWGVMGRTDLAQNAEQMVQRLASAN